MTTDAANVTIRGTIRRYLNEDATARLRRSVANLLAIQPDSIDRIEAILPTDALVLDVGGWAKPLARADYVLDLMPYETRGLYGSAEPGTERFSEQTWVQRDICDRAAWPFDDHQFDFAVCAHTLEDVRDPVWVCQELQRVAKAAT